MRVARRGSVLATSISLVSVFLTLVVAGMAYVESSQNRGLSDKLRLAAEQAARSGMDFVLGFGEANIDRETRLPRAWDSLNDGDIIDPVTEALNLQTNDGNQDLRTIASPGEVMGKFVREYVLGRQGNYITSFKARIQQFRVSDNMPRQYRIGVIGRVRKVRGGGAENIDADERATIVAERVIVAHIGKEPVSKYAALIDIDMVRNWVPGEVVNGPVHINRGYVDEFPLRDGTPVLATAKTGQLINGSTVDADGDAATPPVAFRDLRSRMDIIIDDASLPGNPGFTTPAGAQAHPIFNDEVTVTEIGKRAIDNATNTELKIKNYDYDDTSGGFVLNTTPTNAVTVNGKAWGRGLGHNNYMTRHQAIFRAAANSNTNRYGATGNPYGPTPVSYPIQLPRSVRNRLTAAVGAPPGGIAMHQVISQASLTDAAATRWDLLRDGVYIPTTRFWAIGDGTGSNAPPANQVPKSDSYDAAYETTGGIYIRGNVEVMRMAAKGSKSYYFFQLGPGITNGPRRCYGVFVDRANNTMALKALPASTLSPSSSPDLLEKCIQALAPTRNATTLMNPIGGSYGPMDFCVTNNSGVLNDGGAYATFKGPLGRPAFNGVIYVDCARWDQARPENGTHALNSTPVTGNILCLGDPGAPGSPKNETQRAARALGVDGAPANKNGLLDGKAYEGVATFAGTDVAGPATKLTIMARGNIFIQNHILLDSLVQQDFVHFTGSATPEKDLETLTIDKSKDLLGLVADKQIVAGLAAPSDTTRANIGLYVHAAIAALGDPAFNYLASKVPDSLKAGTAAYAGSFGTEGLLQVYGTREDYKIANRALTQYTDVPTSVSNATTAVNVEAAAVETAQFTYAQKLKVNAAGDVSRELGYPGNPFYEAFFGTANANSPYIDTTAGNPNKGIRGRMRILGSMTEKKRGIKGQGNRSYDKDFIFDKRLLTIAPPIFPSSLNIIVRTQSPFSPDDSNPTRQLPYHNGTAAANRTTARELDFLGDPP